MASKVPGSWVDEARAALSSGWRERVRSALSFTPREMAALGLVVLVIVLGAGVAFVRALPRGAGVSPAPPLSTSASVSVSASGSGSPALVVHVAGAVVRPGVYDFALGARVVDAIRVAGGLAPDADASTLNLARQLTDGERVYVPRRGEAPPAAAGDGGGASSGGAGSKVNINTASVAELDALPGVGPVLAQRIVDYASSCQYPDLEKGSNHPQVKVASIASARRGALTGVKSKQAGSGGRALATTMAAFFLIWGVPTATSLSVLS